MTESQPGAPETKAESGPQGHEITEAFDEFMRAFESFREANDARLGELERRMSSDVVTLDKVERINQALDEHKRQVDSLVVKARRPALAAGHEAPAAAREHKHAFEGYVRRGAEHDLKAIEVKAMSVGSDADGGYLVPDETAREIGRRLAEVSPIRAIAGIREISASVFKKPFAVSGPATGWVGEAAARPETDTGTLQELSFPAMEIYAMPAATQTLLDDAAVSIDEWIAEEVRIAFAEQESAAFVAGDGQNRPRGFLDYDREPESAWEWGKLGYVATGVDGGFAASDPADGLIDLVYTLKAGYRQNAHFVMNRRTQGEVRKLKDGDGRYLWQPAAQAGGPATILNFPVAEAEDMPDIATDAAAIAFGDFRRGYLIVDRLGMRILRDPYSAKPYVLFYTTKRVGGGVQDFDAIKLMSFGES